ncbi:MAG: FAD-binding oxidoreductase [Thermacetogeniaceae bacterium]
MEKIEALLQIKKMCAERATDSLFECILYARDLAPVPALLVDPLFRTMPDLVVRPADAEEVSAILKLASAAGIPVTPRAGASTVYFNTVPARGGIVLDLNLLRGVVELDEENLTVTVKAATTWGELEHYLNTRGLAPLSVPSSAPSASIGGWFTMMGYGIGSLKYGSLLSQVQAAEVVLPDGEIRGLTPESDPPLDWFAASEGTLGIVTRLKIAIRRNNPMRHYLLHSPNLGEIAEVLMVVKDSGVTPYNLHFTDDACVQAMHRQGIAPDGVSGGCLLAIDYEGMPEELAAAEQTVESLVAVSRTVSFLSPEAALEEWDERYKSLKLKRSGPSELGGEVWLPVQSLVPYLADIKQLARRLHLGLCTYGHVASPERAIVMTMFFADETKVFDYIIGLSLVKKIHDVGYRHGGYPYGVGLWNTPYLGRIFTGRRLAELRARKERLDPKGLLNPGKLYRWPLLLNPLFFAVGMDCLAGIRSLTGGGSCR